MEDASSIFRGDSRIWRATKTIKDENPLVAVHIYYERIEWREGASPICLEIEEEGWWLNNHQRCRCCTYLQ